MSPKSRSMLGVTLLEIMLVLAIAGMIIVMSIRYYQSASSSGQVNSAAQQVQAVTAAEESILQTGGAYVASTDSQFLSLLPKKGLVLPWGSSLKVEATTTTFTVTLPSTPSNVCASLKAKVLVNNRFTSSSVCDADKASDLAFVYSQT